MTSQRGELLRIDNLSKTFSINAGGFFSKPLKLRALQDLSFSASWAKAAVASQRWAVASCSC
jgi:hypothetical protein